MTGQSSVATDPPQSIVGEHRTAAGGESEQVVLGTVRDRESGIPLPDAMVMAYEVRSAGLWGKVLATTITDAGGMYLIRLPRLPEDALLRVHADKPGFGEELRLVESVATGPDNPLDLELSRIAVESLVGRVVDQNGCGIPDALVTVEPRLDRLFEFKSQRAAGLRVEHRTDSDGGFVIDCFPVGETFSLLAEAGPCLTQVIVRDVDLTSDLRDPPITLLPASTWTVEVVDEHAAPATAAEVRVAVDSSDLRRRLNELRAQNRSLAQAYENVGQLPRQLGASGRIVLEHVPRGTHRLEVGIAGGDRLVQTVEVDQPELLTTVVLSARQRPDVSVVVIHESGKIVDEYLRASQGVWERIPGRIRAELGVGSDAVVLDFRASVADGSGATTEFPIDERRFVNLSVPFKVASLPATVSLRLGNVLLGQEEVRLRGEVVRFVVSDEDVLRYLRESCAILRCQIVSAVDGKVPLQPCAVIHLLQEGHSDGGGSRGGLAPGHVPSGKVNHLVAPGAGVLMVRAVGCGQRTVRFDAAPKQLLDLGTISLPPGGPLEVELTGPSGYTGTATVELIEYPSGAPVLLWVGVFQIGTSIAVQIPPGRLSHGPLAPGDYVMHVRAPGCEAVERAIRIVGGQKNRVDVLLGAAR